MFSKIRVLLVDDDPAARRRVELQLQRQSRLMTVEIAFAVSLEECKASLANKRFDVILLDLGLPDSKGLQTIASVRSACGTTPIIVLTNDPDDDLDLQALKSGASDYLQKDQLQGDTLTRTIRHTLERHEIRQQLRDERDRMLGYLDQAGAIFLAINTSGQISMINKAGAKLLDVRQSELLGANWFETFIPPSEREEKKQIFDQMLYGDIERFERFECDILTANNTRKTIAWSHSLLTEVSGEVNGVLSVGTDITLIRDTERQIREYNRLKSEFVITVSHELRTPLTIFKNVISNALAGVCGKISVKLRRNLEAASEAVDRLARIISDFLDISRIEAGKMKLEASAVSMQSLVSGTMQTLEVVINENNMSHEVHLPTDDILVFADPNKIKQVIGNLIENAVKFVPNCGGMIIVRVTDQDEHVRVSVEDNGPGIDKKNLQKVFDRFVQIEKHVGEGTHGTGLGLAICKELIEMHGGRIWAENAESGGAMFSFVLPKYEEQMQDDAIAEQIDYIRSQIDEIADLCSSTTMTSIKKYTS